MKNKVEIITIGDEILIGQIVDTNSAWMSKALNEFGFNVFQITSVSDEKSHILSALATAFSRAEIVLVTGGLGPTKDDLTKQCLCEFFGTELVFNDEAFANVERLIKNRPNAMNDLNRQQAYVPQACDPIVNREGTAPIMWFERVGRVLVSMPGVPSEMKRAMTDDVLPRLRDFFECPKLIHQNILVQDYSETQLAIKIKDWEEALPSFLKLAYLPQTAYMKLRLSGESDDSVSLQNTIENEVKKLQTILGTSIVAYDDIAPEVLLADLLKEKHLTLATAESCTGGNIAHYMTKHAGSSAFFKGGVVAYSNEVKANVLKVNAADIEKYGAVSQPVVEQMAQGAARVIGTDVAVATSGIAGPDGGTPDKPVGTIWMAVSDGKKTISKCCHFGNFREKNIEKATINAIFLVKEFVEK